MKVQFVYTTLPIDLNYVEEIFPLGHLKPPEHTIPTNHIYWELKKGGWGNMEDGYSKPVRAPADGVITNIVFRQWMNYPDYAVYIRHTNTFQTKFAHLSQIDDAILNKIGSPLKEGHEGNKVYVPVKTGVIIGKTSADYAQSAALDMGTLDRNTEHFIHPEKYPVEIPNSVCPLNYFAPELKQEVFQKVKRIAEPRCGEFDFDIKGKLVGNWILKGTSGDSPGNAFWNNFISFVYDMYDPNYLRISMGMELGGFLCRVDGNGPDFKDISIKSGKVVYRLIPVGEGDEFLGRPLAQIVTGTLLIEMINDEKIKLELFQGNVSNPSFTQNAKYYTR